MPTALGTALVTAIGVTGTAATVLGAAVGLGISVGLSALAGAIVGKPKPSDGQLLERVAVGGRFRDYGIVHSGGQLTMEESRNGTLAQVVTLATGKQSEILEHRIHDQVVTVDGAGLVTDAKFRGALHIYTRPGDPDQTAISELAAAGFTEWTSDHRQLGCPHAAIILDPVDQKHFSEVTNGQKPVYSQVRKGVPLYDPRLDDTAVIGTDEAGAAIMGSGSVRLDDATTWPWSDNAALVIADFAGDRDGYGLGRENVNWTNIAQEADIADEEVTTVGAETIARWRIWARYGLARDERKQVLADMIAACDGMYWQDGDGLFNLKVGRWEAPVVTITDDHILAMTATRGPKATQRASALKMLYTEASIGYREQEGALIAVPGSSEDPNTEPEAVPLYYAPHHNQAARIGKLMAARLGDRWRITGLFNLFGLNLVGKRSVRIESAILGVAADFILEGELQLDFERMAIRCSLVEVREADWDFDAETEEGTPPASASTGPGTIAIEVPAGLALSAVQVELSGANGVAIEASWDAAARAGLFAQVQYKPTAASEWIEMTVSQDERTALSGLVKADGSTEYQVRARFYAIGGLPGAWTGSATITPTADTIIYDGGDAAGEL